MGWVYAADEYTDINGEVRSATSDDNINADTQADWFSPRSSYERSEYAHYHLQQLTALTSKSILGFRKYQPRRCPEDFLPDVLL